MRGTHGTSRQDTQHVVVRPFRNSTEHRRVRDYHRRNRMNSKGLGPWMLPNDLKLIWLMAPSPIHLDDAATIISNRPASRIVCTFGGWRARAPLTSQLAVGGCTAKPPLLSSWPGWAATPRTKARMPRRTRVSGPRKINTNGDFQETGFGVLPAVPGRRATFHD